MKDELPILDVGKNYEFEPKFRMSEIYPSVQGEGPNVGTSTVFVRFAGCNLRCPGWPCDTQHAIDPAKYRGEWIDVSWEDLVQQTMDSAYPNGIGNITLTGGEPFLQPRELLDKYTRELVNPNNGFGINHIDCFSNGTREYPVWAVNRLSFIMDWKLPSSREDPYDQNRINNLNVMRHSSKRHSIKFVIGTIEDLELAIKLWLAYVVNRDVTRGGDGAFNIYYGKVWNGKLSEADLVTEILYRKLPWKLNVQMHNYIYPPNERLR